MKEIELRNVKGCVDYSPREQYIRNYISDTLKKVFEKYGFKPLQTPLLCYYDLLALKYDEENDILKESAFDKLQEIMSEAGELTTKAPYDKIVNNSFAEKVSK